MKKQLFSLLFALSFGVSACANSPATQTNTANTEPKQEEQTAETEKKTEETVEKDTNTLFGEFLDDLFVQELKVDYNSFHTYVQNENDFGINRDDIEVTLGDFTAESDKEEEKRDEKNLKTIQSFNYDELGDVEKDIYDQLVYRYELNKKMSDGKYTYLGNNWSGTSSATTSLYNLFMEYSFYSERDIDDCITLINDTPRYLEQVMQFTKEQAEKGLLMIEYDTVVDSVKDIISSKDKDNVLNALVKEMKVLKLSEDKENEYTDKIRNALNESFYPSFQMVLDELAKVKDLNKPHKGLSKIKNGKEYYLSLLKHYTGTSDDPEQIRERLNNMLDSALSVIYSTYSDENASTGFKSTKEIMKHLEKNYTQEFPEIKIPKYNVEALSKEQEQENVVAYYVIPAIDYTGSEKIRYNSHSSRANIDGLEFYQTLAHEGIPGHMYVNEYNREHYKYNIQHILSCLGYSEGYATYVESRCLHFLTMDKDTLKFENAYMALNNAYTCLMDLSVNYDGLSYKEFVKEYGDLFGTDLEDLYNTLCESPGIFMAYYYGYFTILDLRSQAAQELQDKFDNVKFNDALLHSGEVNFDIITRNVKKYIKSEK